MENQKPVKIKLAEWNNFHNKIWPKVKEHQRFGQAFFNHFSDHFRQGDIRNWPEMFYAKEISTAYSLIHEKVEIV